MALHDEVDRIESREDLAEFIKQLQLDLERNPESWENPDLATFLDALAAWTTDMMGYFKNQGIDPAEIPVWQLVGNMLLAARSYE